MSPQHVPIGTRFRTAGKTLMLSAALVATFFLFAVAAARIAVRTREVAVPQLVGRTVPEASAALTALGLTLRVDENRRVDAKVPAGRIMLQDPPEGAIARRPRSVKVWVSSGPRVTRVPGLVGESERTAQLRLQQEELELASVSEIRSNEYPADTIIAQEPAANTRTSRVALLVNRGARGGGYVMPDLIGVDAGRAAALLRSKGFRVAIVGETPYPGVPEGIVIRQSPAAGFQIAAGETISLEVSR